jgi:peptidoglycan/LPS O-acetylase OafA/YrhL
MLIASVILLTFVLVGQSIAFGPSFDRNIYDSIPGLLFIHPSIIYFATRVKLQSLDHPFWTLYVEVTFYAVFGLALAAKRSRERGANDKKAARP